LAPDKTPACTVGPASRAVSWPGARTLRRLRSCSSSSRTRAASLQQAGERGGTGASLRLGAPRPDATAPSRRRLAPPVGSGPARLPVPFLGDLMWPRSTATRSAESARARRVGVDLEVGPRSAGGTAPRRCKAVSMIDLAERQRLVEEDFRDRQRRARAAAHRAVDLGMARSAGYT